MDICFYSLGENGHRQSSFLFIRGCPAEIKSQLEPFTAQAKDCVWAGNSICTGQCTIRELCRVVLITKDPAAFAAAKLRGFAPEDEMAVEYDFSLDPQWSQIVEFHVYE